ncbi:hypothetical protein CC86DRAFT_187286 [Ophiobolus disseminans]|uniref:Mid2 domain-containing protein n=1 Tax=Ophiobolus disseminans TaxID=1469910 RepID=A0A6A7A7J9_9PLEO|nr:hypothetical protein CC86DRAFT_187286 [Ophiobolus disseminans]
MSTSTNSHAANQTSTDKNSTTIGLAVGLGVGIPLLLGLLALTFFCLRRHNKNKATPTTPAPTEPIPPTTNFQNDKKDVAASHGFKAELDGTPHISSPAPSEMQDTSVVGSPYGSPVVSPATIHEGFEGAGADEIYKLRGGGKVGGQAHEMAG